MACGQSLGAEKSQQANSFGNHKSCLLRMAIQVKNLFHLQRKKIEYGHIVNVMLNLNEYIFTYNICFC